VPVHNGIEFVRDCLATVVASLAPGNGLIVVDDGSDAPTRDQCTDFVARHPFIRLIRRPEASGFTRAANAGLRESDADYQILLNSDTLVPPDWIGKIIRCGESAPDIGLVGPLSGAPPGNQFRRFTRRWADWLPTICPEVSSIAQIDELCTLGQ
jgi:GT2 family glycosyltransferase